MLAGRASREGRKGPVTLPSSWGRPVPCPPCLPQNSLGVTDSQERVWGIWKNRDLALLEALGGGMGAVWRSGQRGLAGGFCLERPPLLDRWFSPVVQDPSQSIPLWKDGAAPAWVTSLLPFKPPYAVTKSRGFAVLCVLPSL